MVSEVFRSFLPEKNTFDQKIKTKSMSLPEFQYQIDEVGLEMPRPVKDFEGDYLLECDQSLDQVLGMATGLILEN